MQVQDLGTDVPRPTGPAGLTDVVSMAIAGNEPPLSHRGSRLSASSRRESSQPVHFFEHLEPTSASRFPRKSYPSPQPDGSLTGR